METYTQDIMESFDQIFNINKNDLENSCTIFKKKSNH
jgi:hypothetical protein